MKRNVRRRVFKFVGDLWNAVRKRDVTVHVRLGLGDPAETGKLWAVVGPVAGIASTIRDATIEIEPEFSDKIFAVDSSGSIQIVPLQIAYLSLAFIMSPTIWQGLRQA